MPQSHLQHPIPTMNPMNTQPPTTTFMQPTMIVTTTSTSHTTTSNLPPPPTQISTQPISAVGYQQTQFPLPTTGPTHQRRPSGGNSSGIPPTHRSHSRSNSNSMLQQQQYPPPMSPPLAPTTTMNVLNIPLPPAPPGSHISTHHLIIHYPPGTYPSQIMNTIQPQITFTQQPTNGFNPVPYQSPPVPTQPTPTHPSYQVGLPPLLNTPLPTLTSPPTSSSVPSLPHGYTQQFQQHMLQLQQQQQWQQQEFLHQEQLRRAIQQSMDQNILPTRPASSQAIDELRAEPITDRNTHPSCTICLMDFEVNEEQVFMPCQHSFHRPCIKTWLQIRNTCPCCRYELMTDDPVYNRTIRATTSFRSGESGENEDMKEEDSFSSSTSSTTSSTSSSSYSSRRTSRSGSPAVSPTMSGVSQGPPGLVIPPLPPFPMEDHPPWPMEPLLQYHTLHHLQTLAAAQFSALAQQAQYHQQQQQQLIYYQQQLWQAQRQLQASLSQNGQTSGMLVCPRTINLNGPQPSDGGNNNSHMIQ